MITCREYLNKLYDVLLGDNNEGYIGTKTTLRYMISLKTKCFINKNYLNKTLSIFRDLNILGQTILNVSSKEIMIGDNIYEGSKSLYPVKRMDSNILLNKLMMTENLIINTFYSNVIPVITKKELNEYKKILKDKKELALKELDEVPKELFSNKYDKNYGIWIYDINPGDFKVEREKLLKYTDIFFIEFKEKQKIKLKEKKQEEDKYEKINELYSELISETNDRMIEYIKINDYINVSINKAPSLCFNYSRGGRIKHTHNNLGFLNIKRMDIENEDGESSKLVFSNELGCIKTEILNIDIIEDEDCFYKIAFQGYANEIVTEPFLTEYEGLKLKGILDFIKKINNNNDI